MTRVKTLMKIREALREFGVKEENIESFMIETSIFLQNNKEVK